MIKQVAIPLSFPSGAESNGFIAAWQVLSARLKNTQTIRLIGVVRKTITASIAAIVGPSRLQDIRKAFITLFLPRVDWRSPLIIPKMT